MRLKKLLCGQRFILGIVFGVLLMKKNFGYEY
jgi:hypothetical protein